MIIMGKTIGMPLAIAAVVLLAAGAAPAADKPPADTGSASKKPMSLTPPKKMAKPAMKHSMPKTAKKPTIIKNAKPAAKRKKSKATAEPKMIKRATEKPMKKSAAARWGYYGDTGPAHWGGLSKSWHTCGAGRQQSPVNLDAAEPGHLQRLALRYKVSVIEMIHTGRTVQANYG